MSNSTAAPTPDGQFLASTMLYLQLLIISEQKCLAMIEMSN
jgi:hypothetical protein